MNAMADRVTKMSAKERKQKIEEGWLHVSVLFELVGNPKKHIEETLQAFLDSINQDEHIITIKEDVEETLELEDSNGAFSAAAEVEYLILGLEKLTWFAFNFLPANIEVKDPGELTFKDKDFSDWINDLLAKLHEVNAVHTSLKSEHQELIKNLNIALRNTILLAIEHEALTTKEIAKKAGLAEKTAQQFLDVMVKDGKVGLEGKKYRKA